MSERMVTDSTEPVDGAKPDVEALREEIRQTRAELGETVQALAAKADVKARAKEQVEYTKARAMDRLHEVSDKAKDRLHDARVQLSGAGAQVGSQLSSAGTQLSAAGSQLSAAGSERLDTVSAEVRRRPMPYAAIVGAGILVAGIILIMRGRRR